MKHELEEDRDFWTMKHPIFYYDQSGQMKVRVDKDSVRPFLVVLSTRADQAYVPGLEAACPAARPHRPR
jgi:hypothetical protein